jgi:hypothetical protein
MSLMHPTCPSCRGELALTHQGALDSWVCPAGHGLALTLSETYERAQSDELDRLWQLARSAGPSSAGRTSPTTGRPMVSIEVPYDGDEAREGEAGDGPDTGSVWLDVDVSDQVIWFDAAELDALPADLPDPQPTAEELAAVDRIRTAFGQSVLDADHARHHGDVTERIYRRIAGNPNLTGLLTEVGSLGRR